MQMRVKGLASFPCIEKRNGVDHCVEDCAKLWSCPLWPVYQDFLRLQDLARATSMLLRHFPHIAAFGRFFTLRLLLDKIDTLLTFSGFSYRRNWIRAKQAARKALKES